MKKNYRLHGTESKSTLLVNHKIKLKHYLINFLNSLLSE